MGRPVQMVNMIINGRKAITAQTALQLQHAFGASATLWMGLESDYQLYKAIQKGSASRSEKTPLILEETLHGLSVSRSAALKAVSASASTEGRLRVSRKPKQKASRTPVK